ncbi:MAG: hypothetical protein ACOYON_08040 [Fimbriimonas sp.]
MAELPAFVTKFFENEEIWIPKLASVLVGGPVLTIWGFYIGTIVGPDHAVDLQWHDLRYGVIGAGIGALVGLLIAVYAWVIFPKSVAAESDHHSH